MSSLFVSEDEVEGFSFPLEGRREDQTSMVKVGSLEELDPFFLIASSLPPCLQEKEETVRSSRPWLREKEVFFLSPER